MSWSGLAKFTLGFTLAIALLFFAGVSATRYLITRLTAPPPRPVFPNDRPSPQASPAAARPTSSPQASPSPTETLEASPSPPGSYRATVTQPIGLIVRQGPGQDTEQIGGVDYEQEVIVLETSSDGGWLRVQLSDGSEGWIKAGNIEQIN